MAEEQPAKEIPTRFVIDLPKGAKTLVLYETKKGIVGWEITDKDGNIWDACNVPSEFKDVD